MAKVFTTEELEKIANEAIEKNLGNVCTSDTLPEIIREEAYTLAFDALHDKGVDRVTAQDMASECSARLFSL